MPFSGQDLNDLEQDIKENAGRGSLTGKQTKYLAFQTLLDIDQLRELREIKRILRDDD